MEENEPRSRGAGPFGYVPPEGTKDASGARSDEWATASGIPPRAPRPSGEDEVISISPRVLWTTTGVIGVVLLLLLSSIWISQRSLSGRFEDLDEGFAALERQVAARADEMAVIRSRLGVVEREVGRQINVAEVSRKVRPSVYTVRTATGGGSAFVIGRKGGRSVLVTNHHVIFPAGQGDRVTLSRKGGGSITGRIDRISARNDLATIIVGRKLPVLSTAGPPKSGDPVVVVGSPLGLDSSVSEGIISGRRAGFIQFTAPVSPGNSGSPLVDRRGRVVGVVSLKIVLPGAEGLNFARPIGQVCGSLTRC